MNPIIQAVLNMLELLWKAAAQDATDLLAEPDFDPAEANKAITRQETIADVIDAVKNLAGEQGRG